MNTRLRSVFPAALLSLASLASPVWAEQDQAGAKIEEVAAFPEQQVTGVAVSQNGRVFVNFPYWSDGHTTSVAEVMKDGTLKPFPDESWNKKEGDPAQRWVCVQSVSVDDTGALWVLDPAAPKQEAVVKGGAKLVKFDLTSTTPATPVQTIIFPEAAAPERSYLNDVRVDTKTGHAYLTESALGSLVVVDLKSGQARRLLAGHKSTVVEPDVTLVVDGLKPLDPKTGKSPSFAADGIALDAENGYLYWHPLTGYTLWRAKLEDLRNEQLTPEQLVAKVEEVAKTPAPDGMLAGKSGTIYLAAFENNGIARYNPADGKTQMVVRDDRMQWPDSMAWGPDGWLYVTASQIHRMPKYNGGVDKREGRPFRVLRVKLP